jgi:hypothetical protein
MAVGRACVARNDRAGHSHPNPVGLGRVTSCKRAIFLRERFVYVGCTGGNVSDVELNSFLTRGPSLVNSGQDAGKTMLLNRQ